MDIRPAQRTDAAGIAHVHVDCWRSTYAGLVPQAHLETLSHQQREKDWDSWLAPSGNIHVFVAIQEHQIVGFASAGAYRGANQDFQAELYAIYLLPEYHRRGIGSRLICEAIQKLLQEQMFSMIAWVFTRNPARQFYEKLGGKQIAEKLVLVGGARLPAVAYGWQDVRVVLERCAGK
ncbi:GNAT family N-acetyltransferase [Pedosphaera parvula]|uniref:GCN5-related N-acetyltransferase n=1 Tax=Pedosphaera parvula (strain Ellin514) TaxID=320771 RepID=B9XRX7_PEDPL|nr:GNAT family N-acetyltransferase [Pedosphaera parvula]EEF57388.1 GCN5-related N-acetyltransferase [Pedosphaera parvula Ellin514]